jgi:hypothetical protein
MESVVTTIGGILGSAILAAIGYTGSTITELSTRIGALEHNDVGNNNGKS